jgi:pyruvate,water dikinase
MVKSVLETTTRTVKEQAFILWFEEVGIADIPLVGGKNASLGEMIQQLIPKGVNVPTGFATTAYAYRYFIDKAGLDTKLRKIFADLDVENVQNLRQRGKQARALILNTPFPAELEIAIEKAYFQLCKRYGAKADFCDRFDPEYQDKCREFSYDTDVAVRSSATAEDLPDASFAGQQETYLNVHGVKQVLEACHKCFASIFTDRAISYRTLKGFDHFNVALSVGVQKMVRSDLASSGVMFSIDTETGFKNAALVTAAYGLGENVVQGAVNPDEFFVFKPTLEKGFRPILQKRLGSKEIKMIYDLGGSKLTKNVPVSESERCKYAISDDEVLTLAKWACIIEDHYSQVRNTYTPMDIEWAKDGQTGELFIVQARPETVQSQKSDTVLRNYKLKGTSEVLVTGRAVGESIGQGKARVILDVHKIEQFQAGEVLVTNKTDPDWEPIMKKASAIVTNQGGRTCFDGETQVLTNRGFISLREIHENGYQGLSTLSLNLKTNKIEWKPIIDSMKKQSNKIAVSISQTGKVKDNLLRLTPDHKMINIRGGKYLKTEIQEMLSRQEMVVIAQQIPELVTENKISSEMAYVLGGIMTDGSLYRNSTHGEVQFIQKNIPEKQAFIQTMNEYMTTLYGKSFKASEKPASSGYIRGQQVKGQATAYRLYSKQAAYDLYDKQQNLVNLLLHSSPTIAYDFLAGAIDGDGCFHDNRLHLYISNNLLLQAIIVACLKIGIVPQVTTNRNIYHVQLVEKLDNLLEFTHRVSGTTRTRTINTRFFATAQLFDEQAIAQIKLRREKNFVISAQKLAEMGEFPELVAGDTRMQRVTATEESSYGDVYNLTIADHHNYVVFTSKYSPVLVCNCHAAIIAREMGIPAIVGCTTATGDIKSDREITVCCAEGEQGKVYAGLVPFEVEETQIDNLPRTRTQILMNVGNPEEALSLAAIPCDGVGLARLEFIIANHIKVHPLALMHFDQLEDACVKQEIAQLTRLYSHKPDYFVDKLTQGIGNIAAAFYPKPVIVRMSDFKSNEYANLLGGKQFEPKEENPMIGWRGASRYYDPKYSQAFGLECQALKRVRNEMGLTNLIPMIPFCRTPDEGRKVLEEMGKYGLRRGENGLQVYVMCEVPSNVILADQYSEIFDGFSIGSNDLTQLTLGLDRDSALVAHIFDERNEAVKQMVRMVIEKAKKNGRKIGICGQAPSDYPEFARFLVELGIDSLSLNPDSVLKTYLDIAELESQM